jgi:hypothetical protein
MDAILSKITFSDVGKRYLLCIGGFQIDLRASTINLARMDTTRLKISFGVVGE